VNAPENAAQAITTCDGPLGSSYTESDVVPHPRAIPYVGAIDAELMSAWHTCRSIRPHRIEPDRGQEGTGPPIRFGRDMEASLRR